MWVLHVDSIDLGRVVRVRTAGQGVAIVKMENPIEAELPIDTAVYCKVTDNKGLSVTFTAIVRMIGGQYIQLAMFRTAEIQPVW